MGKRKPMIHYRFLRRASLRGERIEKVSHMRQKERRVSVEREPPRQPRPLIYCQPVTAHLPQGETSHSPHVTLLWAHRARATILPLELRSRPFLNPATTNKIRFSLTGADGNQRPKCRGVGRLMDPILRVKALYHLFESHKSRRKY